MNVYNLFSKGHRPDLGVVSSRVLSPTGGAKHAHGEVHSAGGTSKVRGEGEGTRPQTYTCVWMVSLVRLVRTLDTSIVLEKFSPINSFFDCKSSKTRTGRRDPKWCVLCLIPNVAKYKDYNYETLFLLQSIISSHTVSRQNTPKKTCLCCFCVETRSINFSHNLDLHIEGVYRRHGG